MNPYLAGLGLGLTLLAAFVLMGRGIGASGAYSAALSPRTSPISTPAMASTSSGGASP